MVFVIGVPPVGRPVRWPLCERIGPTRRGHSMLSSRSPSG